MDLVFAVLEIKWSHRLYCCPHPHKRTNVNRISSISPSLSTSVWVGIASERERERESCRIFLISTLWLSHFLCPEMKSQRIWGGILLPPAPRPPIYLSEVVNTFHPPYPPPPPNPPPPPPPPHPHHTSTTKWDLNNKKKAATHPPQPEYRSHGMGIANSVWRQARKVCYHTYRFLSSPESSWLVFSGQHRRPTKSPNKQNPA